MSATRVRQDPETAPAVRRTQEPDPVRHSRPVSLGLWLDRRVLRPVLMLLTPLGWTSLVAGVVLLWAGLARDWVEALVIGTTLLGTLLLATLWMLGRTDYDAVLEVDRRRIAIGETSRGHLRVKSRATVELFPARMELPVGRATMVFGIPALRRGQRHAEGFRVVGRQRSVIVIGPLRSVRTDPLTLLRRELRWSRTVEVCVHPRTIRLDVSTAGVLRDIEGLNSRKLSSSDMSFHALREYVAGDDRRNVHWRSSARTGRLMVRQFEESRRAHLLVLLDLSRDGYSAAVEFETAVSCAGSIILQALRDNRVVTLVTQKGPLRFSDGEVLLDQLSGLGLTGGVPSVSVLGAEAFVQVPGASVVSVITGSRTSWGELRALKAHVPADLVAYTLRCGGTEAAHRKAGTMPVLDVPDLDELPRAVRSVR